MILECILLFTVVTVLVTATTNLVPSHYPNESEKINEIIILKIFWLEWNLVKGSIPLVGTKIQIFPSDFNNLVY